MRLMSSCLTSTLPTETSPQPSETFVSFIPYGSVPRESLGASGHEAEVRTDHSGSQTPLDFLLVFKGQWLSGSWEGRAEDCGGQKQVARHGHQAKSGCKPPGFSAGDSNRGKPPFLSSSVPFYILRTQIRVHCPGTPSGPTHPPSPWSTASSTQG